MNHNLLTEDKNALTLVSITSYGLAISYLALRRYDEVLLEAEKQLKLDKEYSMAYIFIGKVSERTGKFDDAINKYNLAKDMGNKEADLHLCSVYFVSKQYDKSIEYGEKYLRSGHKTSRKEVEELVNRMKNK